MNYGTEFQVLWTFLFQILCYDFYFFFNLNYITKTLPGCDSLVGFGFHYGMVT